MKALVVYESLLGNTEAIARAVAEGLGDRAVALRTNEATPEALAGADLGPLSCRGTGFETAIWWSPGSSARTIDRELTAKFAHVAGTAAAFPRDRPRRSAQGRRGAACPGTGRRACPAGPVSPDSRRSA